jgi:hypothetical protein
MVEQLNVKDADNKSYCYRNKSVLFYATGLDLLIVDR